MLRPIKYPQYDIGERVLVLLPDEIHTRQKPMVVEEVRIRVTATAVEIHYFMEDGDGEPIVDERISKITPQ